MKKRYLVFLLSLVIACNSNTTTPPQDIVAKVHNYILTKEELKQNVATTSSIIDSINATKQYVKDWAKQKLLYRNAQINLNNTEELEKMVAKYREELYVSYYKNALVNKKLDTLVTQAQIDSFYVQNQSSFKLNEALIKFKYIHLETKSRRERNKIKQLFLSDELQDKEELLGEYSSILDYYFNDSTWVSLEGVYTQKVDFPVLTSYQLSKTDRLTEVKGKDGSIYYICVKDYLNRENTAPIEYVEPTIKNILIHKNKIQFFNQMEQILIDDAVKQKKYEVY